MPASDEPEPEVKMKMRRLEVSFYKSSHIWLEFRPMLA
jgi:hypothetical protein